MKHYLFITLLIILIVLFTPCLLLSQDTLQVRIQNQNQFDCTLEMHELVVSGDSVLSVHPWPVGNRIFPSGMTHFTITSLLHSRNPCFVFYFHDSSNRTSPPSERFCLYCPETFLPPASVHVWRINQWMTVKWLLNDCRMTAFPLPFPALLASHTRRETHQCEWIILALPTSFKSL